MELLHPNPRPEVVTGVSTSNLTATGVKLMWDKSKTAKSYLIHHDVGSGIPTEATFMHYVETNELMFDDALFAGTLAGQKINVYVQAFNETFGGKTEIEQAQNANTTGYGSEWSEPVEIKFPKVTKASKAKAGE